MTRKEIDELVRKFNVVYIRGARPTELITPNRVDLPSNLLIFNAPRPLSGSAIPKESIFTPYTNYYEWMGDFHHGVLYAAVNPDDRDTPTLLRENLESDGWLVQYVPIGEARRWLKNYYAHYGLLGIASIDEASHDYVWAAYVNHRRDEPR